MIPGPLVPYTYALTTTYATPPLTMFWYNCIEIWLCRPGSTYRPLYMHITVKKHFLLKIMIFFLQYSGLLDTYRTSWDIATGTQYISHESGQSGFSELQCVLDWIGTAYKIKRQNEAKNFYTPIFLNWSLLCIYVYIYTKQAIKSSIKWRRSWNGIE